jgi:hypothetical protein
MHKKGITEEVAKKRSRKTVKHQRGIVGADIAAIMARRNQTAAQRTQARQAALAKAKSDKKDKEGKKTKVRFFEFVAHCEEFLIQYCLARRQAIRRFWTQGVEAADEGWQGRQINVSCNVDQNSWYMPSYVFHITSLHDMIHHHEHRLDHSAYDTHD